MELRWKEGPSRDCLPKDPSHKQPPNPDIAVSCEAMPVPAKYRSRCSQSSIGWSTGSLMKELEKVPKELKGFAAP